MIDRQTNNNMTDLVERVRAPGTRLLLLDFDGTLVDFTSDIGGTIPSEELLDILSKTGVVPDNHMVIITGRRRDDIERLIGKIPADIIAEHGAMIRQNQKWRILLEDNTEWKKEVFSLLRKFCDICPNSMIEEKSYSIAWHYRIAEQETGIASSRALISELKKIAVRYNLIIFDGNKVVEVISRKINKGIAVQYLLEKRKYDHILALGDDKTDEEMFKVLLNKENAYTVKIGEGETLARYRLQNPSRVLILLEYLLSETE
jgi:trehalose 6-phosphate synthase/phosphatase